MYIILNVVIIILLLGLLWKQSKEHLMIPGVANREETKAVFLEDRTWFEQNEKDFYSRYRT